MYKSYGQPFPVRFSYPNFQSFRGDLGYDLENVDVACNMTCKTPKSAVHK